MSDEKQVAQAVESVENKGAPDEIALSSGVILGVKPSVNPMVFIDILDALEKDRPKVPTVYIESLGRYEENPDHPDYKARVSAWDTRLAKRLVDALILLGTYEKYIPDDIPVPEDDEWTEAYVLLGMTIGTSKKERYLSWVKNIAVQTPEDYALVQERVSEVAGIQEQEVAKATNSFPSRNRRR